MAERPPVRLVHLGLGAFHRAHQAWYTELANRRGDTEPYGIWAFTGRRPDAARVLAGQDGRYTLIERGPDGDRAETIEALVRADDGADRDAWLTALSAEAVVACTLTVTEAGYRVDDEDLSRLRDDASTRSVPGRLVDGLRARCRAGGAPLAVLSCDNLSGNGAVTRELVVGLAERLDPALRAWIEEQVSFPNSMVDRITPATTAADRETAERLAGWPDRAPVVTEPFSEWVIERPLPSAAPDWDRVGVQLVDDVAPYEQRKLWLLNGAHSLLTYLGRLRGHETVAQAMEDQRCVEAVSALWSEAAEVLPFDTATLDAATTRLTQRFGNARIEHQLAQIGTDGWHKLPRRIVDVQRARRAAGLPLGTAGSTALAAWTVLVERGEVDDSGSGLVDRLRGATNSTVRAAAVLSAMAPDLADDPELTGLVVEALDTLGRDGPHPAEPTRRRGEEHR